MAGIFKGKAAVGHGECLLGHDTFTATVTLKDIRIIEFDQEAVLVIPGVTEIKASPGDVGIVGGGEGGASHFQAQSATQLKDDIPDDLAERLERDLTGGDWSSVDALLADAAPRSEPYIGAEPMEPPALRAISLNVAQTCNMGCGYCYADEGRFGGNARHRLPHCQQISGVLR